MAALHTIMTKVDDGLRDPNRPWHVLFQWAEARTGVDRFKLFLGFACTVAAYLCTASYDSASLLADLIGFAYPAYVTVGTMLSSSSHRRTGGGGGGAVDANVRWLTYWLMFAAVLFVQQVCSAVLRLLPHYSLLKIAFFAWSFAPIETNGAALVYATVVRRYFAGNAPPKDYRDG